MSLSRLNTRHIADKVADQLDTYATMDLISTQMQRKLTSFRVLLEAINEADIQLSGFIKQQAQVVVFAREGQAEVFLRNGDFDEEHHYQGITDSGVSDRQVSLFLNEAPWTQIGQIRSQYIYMHSDYPINDSTPGRRLRLEPFTMFQKRKTSPQDCDVHGEQSGYVYYDPARFRLRLDNTLSQDCFFTFEAWLLPEKINFEDFGNDDFCSYPVCCPEYASKALELQTLAEIMPAGLEITAGIQAQADNEKMRVISRMPRNHSTLTVQPRF